MELKELMAAVDTTEELYLDHNATAAARPEAVEAMLPWLGRAANPSSAHSVGSRARDAVEVARAQVADLVGSRPRDVVFTSGATEANNLALRGSGRGRRLVVSAVEHPSILQTAQALRAEGQALEIVAPDSDGVITAEAVAKHLGSGPAFVSVMLANNETGVINNLPAIAEISPRPDSLLHTDATQAVGRRTVVVHELGVDLLSLSGHKFGGPQGVGALIASRHVALPAVQTGGEQERGRRSGTLNVAGIVGMGAAAAAVSHKLEDEVAKLRDVRDHFEQLITSFDPAAVIVGAGAPRLPNTSLLLFPGTQAEAVMTRCPGLAISHGSACAAGAPGPSHVLRAMNIPDRAADSALRISFGPENTRHDAERAARQIAAAAADLRSLHTPGEVA